MKTKTAWAIMPYQISAVVVLDEVACQKRPRGFQAGNPYRCKLLRVGAIESGRPVVQRWIVTGTGKVMKRLPSIERTGG
jgi:hypothetical protein